MAISPEVPYGMTYERMTAPEVDGLNQVLGRFRHGAGDFVETRFPI